MAQQEAREVDMYYMKLFEDIVNDNIEWLTTSYPGLIMDCDELVEYLGELFTDLFVGGEQYLKEAMCFPGKWLFPPLWPSIYVSVSLQEQYH